MPQIFHPLLALALIASTTDRELAKYIQVVKAAHKILRARLPEEIHTRPSERERLKQFGNALGRAIEERISIVSRQAPSLVPKVLRVLKERGPKIPHCDHCGDIQWREPITTQIASTLRNPADAWAC